MDYAYAEALEELRQACIEDLESRYSKTQVRCLIETSSFEVNADFSLACFLVGDKPVFEFRINEDGVQLLTD